MNANIGRPKNGRPQFSTKERLPIDRKLHEGLLYYVGRSDLRERVKDKITMAYTILHHTGLRASELLDLTFKDLNDAVSEGKWSLSNKNKTKSTRLIQITKRGRKEFEELIEGYEGDLDMKVFTNRNGEELSKSPFIRVLNRHIHSFLGPLHSSHSYRQSYVTDLLKVASPNLVQKAVGHKSVTTTLRYGFSSNEDILKKLEAVRGEDEDEENEE